MKLKTIAAVVVALVSSAPCAFAEENPYSKTYDATYDYYMPSGPTTMRLSSDGQGRLRSEIQMAGRPYVSITDWNQKATFSIDDQSRAVSKMDYKTAPGATPPDDSKRTSLGEKVVEGKTCDGWQYISNGRTSEMWVDKDSGATVLMTLDNKPQMKLKFVSKTSIGQQYFQAPPGYRVHDLNEQMRRAQELAKKYQNQRHR